MPLGHDVAARTVYQGGAELALPHTFACGNEIVYATAHFQVVGLGKATNATPPYTPWGSSSSSLLDIRIEEGLPEMGIRFEGYRNQSPQPLEVLIHGPVHPSSAYERLAVEVWINHT